VGEKGEFKKSEEFLESGLTVVRGHMGGESLSPTARRWEKNFTCEKSGKMGLQKRKVVERNKNSKENLRGPPFNQQGGGSFNG